jgi:hypothetical protein
MKRPIYLAGKDAVYHILRISINGFMKVLEGLRVDGSGERHDCYLEFCSCFLVDLWPLVFHGSCTDNTGANTGAMHATYFVAVYGFRGETPTPIFNGYLGWSGPSLY